VDFPNVQDWSSDVDASKVQVTRLVGWNLLPTQLMSGAVGAVLLMKVVDPSEVTLILWSTVEVVNGLVPLPFMLELQQRIAPLMEMMVRFVRVDASITWFPMNFTLSLNDNEAFSVK